MKSGYAEFIKEYINLGYAHEIEVPNQNEINTNVYYKPHHAVFKEASSTTKLKVVFNASASSSSGISLNDILLTGPIVQPDLFSLLLRFRMFKYALTADIKKMYHQVNIKQFHP